MKLLLRKILKTPVVTEPGTPAMEGDIQVLGEALHEEVRRRFGRSMHIREVDPGSCNGCELEISGLNSPYYDLERFGLQFVASPRHADCLLVTGPVTRNMEDPLKRTYAATPDPKIAVAVGDCAKDCGIFAGGYGVVGPVSAVIPVDIDLDARRDHPYAVYDKLKFQVPVFQDGDVLTRMMVRVHEARESVNLIVQALGALPPGEMVEEIPPMKNGASAFGLVEGWRGPIWHWVVFGAKNMLARVKVKDPSFANWPALNYAILKNIVPDFPLCNKSFNLSYAGNDL
jgi:Ni,Fe-hydrogenase III small subunit